MHRLFWAVFAVSGVVPAFAETYDSRLDFVDATGTQYIDTGIVPNSRNTRVVARFLVLERPTTPIGLLGTFADLGDGSGNILRGDLKNCALSIGKYGGNYRILPNWTLHPDWSGYYYPVSGDYTENFAYTVDFHRSWGTVDGFACAYDGTKGYKDDERPDAYLGETATLFLGDINDSTGAPSTLSGSRLKARWYGMKVYDGETLVGDFIPVMKDGIAGFFDEVTKTFFRSKEGDFEAPAYCTWTGAGDLANLQDPDNYENGNAPSTSRSVIVVPASTEVLATYQDTAFLNGIGGVRLQAESSTFAFTNGNWTSGDYVKEFIAGNANGGATLRCGIFGCGTFANRDSVNTSTTRWLYLCGDSGDFAGRMVFTNAAVWALSQYALGAEKCRVYYYSSPDNNTWQDRRRFRIGPAAHYDFEFHVGRCDNYVLAERVYLDGDIYLEDEAGNLNFFGNNAPFGICGTVRTPYEKRVTMTMDTGAYFEGPGEKWLGLHNVKLNSLNANAAGKKYHPVGAKLHTTRQPYNDANTSQMNFSVDSSTRVYFNLADAFDPTAYLMLRQGRSGTTATTSQLDLNGFDQQLGILDSYTDASAAGCALPDFYDAGCCITSTAPAKLTIYECCRNGRSAVSGQGDYKSTFIGRVEGAASIVLDSTNDLCSTKLERAISFNAPGSGTTGGLYAKNGTIRLWETASFPNLSVLEASGEGKLDIRTSAVGGGDLLVSCTNLMSGATGVITLAEGVTLSAKTAFVGGRWLGKGIYGSAEAVAAAEGTGVMPLKQLSGLGLLSVAEFGGRPGLMLIVR